MEDTIAALIGIIIFVIFPYTIWRKYKDMKETIELQSIVMQRLRRHLEKLEKK